MKSILLSVVIFLSLNAYSGELDDVFDSGIFGTEWGQTYEDILKVFPDGEKETSYGSTRITVEDGREVLGIERDSDSEIVFGFDAKNRLYSVGVNFGSEEAYVKLIRKLDTLFGGHIKDEVMLKWKDERITLSLIYLSGMFSAETVLGIQYLALKKNTKSKEELGF